MFIRVALVYTSKVNSINKMSKDGEYTDDADETFVSWDWLPVITFSSLKSLGQVHRRLLRFPLKI
jgi:hypothetical protein